MGLVAHVFGNGVVEAAMSLNTLAYNTSIALGAFFGGLLADRLGVDSVFWCGAVLTAAALALALGSGRTTAVSRGEARATR